MEEKNSKAGAEDTETTEDRIKITEDDKLSKETKARKNINRAF